MTRRDFALSAMGGSILLSSCNLPTPVPGGTATVATWVDAITAAVEIALPVVEAAVGLPVPVGALINTYLSGTITAVNQTIAELQTTDTALVKYQKILGYFATVVAPGNLTASGVPPLIASLVTAVINAVQTLLTNLAGTASAVTVPMITAPQATALKMHVASVTAKHKAALRL